MIIALIISGLLIVCLIWFSMAKIKVNIQALINGFELEAKTEVNIQFGLIKYKKQLSFDNLNRASDEQNYVAYFQENKQNLKQQFKKIIKELATDVKIDKFVWVTKIGLGEAPLTYMTAGMFWTLKSVFIPILNQHIECRNKPIIDVKTFDHQYIIQIELQCISYIRAGKAIYIGMKLYKKWKKLKKKKMNTAHSNRRTAHV